jgi:hypothetical protein
LLSIRPLTFSHTSGTSFFLRDSTPAPSKWRVTAFLTLSLALVGPALLAPPRLDEVEGWPRVLVVGPEPRLGLAGPDASISRSPSLSVGRGRPLDRLAMPPRDAALDVGPAPRGLPPRRELGAMAIVASGVFFLWCLFCRVDEARPGGFGGGRRRVR